MTTTRGRSQDIFYSEISLPSLHHIVAFRLCTALSRPWLRSFSLQRPTQKLTPYHTPHHTMHAACFWSCFLRLPYLGAHNLSLHRDIFYPRSVLIASTATPGCPLFPSCPSCPPALLPSFPTSSLPFHPSFPFPILLPGFRSVGVLGSGLCAACPPLTMHLPVSFIIYTRAVSLLLHILFRICVFPPSQSSQ